MKKKKDARRRFSAANSFQKKILSLVFFSTVIPMIISIICLYYLIFNIIAGEMVFPEAIGSILIPAAKKVAVMAALGFLVSLFLIWIWAVKVSHRLAGPLERLCRELDSRVSGKAKGYIYFRRNDYLASIAGRINSLLDRLK